MTLSIGCRVAKAFLYCPLTLLVYFCTGPSLTYHSLRWALLKVWSADNSVGQHHGDVPWRGNFSGATQDQPNQRAEASNAQSSVPTAQQHCTGPEASESLSHSTSYCLGWSQESTNDQWMNERWVSPLNDSLNLVCLSWGAPLSKKH